MSLQQHAAAVLALLQADTGPPQLVVYDGYVPDASLPPYVVVYFTGLSVEAAQDPDSSDMTALSRRNDIWVYAHCVGANGQATRSVAARVANALLDVAPTVTGRTCFPIRHVENQPAARDETTGKLVMDQVDVYRLSSIPNS